MKPAPILAGHSETHSVSWTKPGEEGPKPGRTCLRATGSHGNARALNLLLWISVPWSSERFTLLGVSRHGHQPFSRGLWTTIVSQINDEKWCGTHKGLHSCTHTHTHILLSNNGIHCVRSHSPFQLGPERYLSGAPFTVGPEPIILAAGPR